MLKIRYSNRFKKDYKLIQKRGYDTTKLKDVVKMLVDGISLPTKYRDHFLTGNYNRF